MFPNIPDFDEHGLLPPGDYPVTFPQLLVSSLVLGPQPPLVYPQWDAAWRAYLVGRLQILANQLWKVGVEEIFVDGSFVEDKDHPNDIDGYFVCDAKRLRTGELQRSLNLLDSYKVWNWDPNSRKPYRGYPKRQLPMWHIYRVELYPHIQGNPCGIRDEHGNELEFPAAFRRSRRDGRPRGIVKLVKESPHDPH